MLRITLLLSLCLLLDSSAVAEEWKPIFNGKDLTGWTPKIVGHAPGDNYADTFRVEDGILKVRFDRYEGDYNERFGHLFYDKPLSHYRLRVECRSVGEQVPGGPQWAHRNSGVMLHGQSPESMLIGQSFPVSLEAQLLTGNDDGKPRPTANLCTPGTHVTMKGALHKPHCTSSTSPTIKHGEWVTVEMEVNGGGTIRHLVNGKPVMEYSRPVLDPTDPDAKRLLDGGAEKQIKGGTISLQAESSPFDFRKVELLELQGPE